MKTVPDDHRPGQKLECSGWSWPIIDAACMTLFFVGAYELGDAGVDTLTAIPVLIGLLYAISSGTGFYWANQCRQAGKSRVELKGISSETQRLLEADKPAWARTKEKPAPGPRRAVKSVPVQYRHLCKYTAGTMVRLETKTKVADVKFLKCTSTGVEVERQDKKVGVIAFSRIWKISKTSPAVLTESPAKPVAVQPPEPPPEPVVEAKPAAKPPPVREVAVEIEVETAPVTSGAFLLNNVKVFWGLGVSLGISDPYSARRRSDRRARTEIFELFKRNLNIFAGMAPEDIQARQAALEKAAVKETMIVDRWLNTGEDSCTSVAVLPVAECGLDPREANILWDRISRGRSESR